MICPVCHGNGYVRRPRAAIINRFLKYTNFRVQEHMNCPACNAQGEVYAHRKAVNPERSDTELLTVGQ